MHVTEIRPPFEEAPALKRFSMHMRHGFFGRRGGVSQGVYRSLNCGLGSADDPARIAENRRRVAEALGGSAERLITLRQVHSAQAVVVDKPFAPGQAPEVDGLVTNRPKLVLGVLAADCAPVLLCDPHAGVIGAAHAGWRGALGGVVEATVEAMIGLGADPSRMSAGVGPCLSQDSFEVGPDLADAVLHASAWAEHLFERGAGDRQHFDLKGYVQGRLARMGVAQIDALSEDTLTMSDRYFSHRRAVKSGDPEAGRNISAITLVA
jgi:polyphenol oxidase